MTNITFWPIVMHQNPSDEHTPRIVNGNEVLSDRLRGMVVVLFTKDEEGYSWCSGSLISASWVVSAALCDIRDTTQVVVGARRVEVRNGVLGTEGGELLGVLQVIQHPDYSESSDSAEANDITLVQLARLTSSTQFMRVNTNPNIPERGSFTRFMGYGDSVDGPEPISTSNILRQIDMPVFPLDQCGEIYPGEIFPERHICVGYARRECGICFGDAGGPLFQYDEDGNPVQIGIQSRSNGCALLGFPSYYTRMSAFVDWMRANGADFTQADQVQTVFNETSEEDDDPEKDGSKIGIIIGSVAGALLGIIIIIFVLYKLCDRCTREPSINDDHNSRNSRELVPENDGDNRLIPEMDSTPFKKHAKDSESATSSKYRGSEL